MNVEEFIEQSLRQIISGVQKAHGFAPRYEWSGRDGDTVNPKVMDRADHAPKGKFYTTTKGDLVQFIEFDIAVTVESGSEAKGNAGIKVIGFGGVGAGGSLSESSSSVSRLRFQVPLALPTSSMNEPPTS